MPGSSVLEMSSFWLNTVYWLVGERSSGFGVNRRISRDKQIVYVASTLAFSVLRVVYMYTHFRHDCEGGHSGEL